MWCTTLLSPDLDLGLLIPISEGTETGNVDSGPPLSEVTLVQTQVCMESNLTSQRVLIKTLIHVQYEIDSESRSRSFFIPVRNMGSTTL